MASYIKTLKEDNGDITYPQTLGSAVLLTGGADLETELAGKASAASVAGKIDIGDVQSSDIVSEAVTTAKIADGAVTVPKLSNALAYKPGDIFTFATGPNIAAKNIGLAASIAAALTGGNQNLYFEIPMGKSLANITSATINSMRGPIRGHGGYLANSSSDTSDIVTNASSITVDVNKDRNCLMVLALRTSGWGGTNNSTYNFQVIDGSITLS